MKRKTESLLRFVVLERGGYNHTRTRICVPVKVMTPAKHIPSFPPVCPLPPSQIIRRNSRGTWWNAIALGVTGLGLLQQLALPPLTHRELEHLSSPGPVSFGRLRV